MHPILFQWGGITLYSYGLMLAAGFVAGAALAARRAARIGLDPARIQTLAGVLLLAGIAGARGMYVLLHWEMFRSDPLEIIRLDHGGLVFYGGLAAGAAAGIAALRRLKLPFGKTVDLMIPPLVLAHAAGRIGCFLNGCCYGKPAALPWAVAFPGEGILRHPAALYESGALFLLFFFLKALESRSPRTGTVALSYGAGYGSLRFLAEFLRGDHPAIAGGLTFFQWLSLPLLFVCGWLLLQRARRRA